MITMRASNRAVPGRASMSAGVVVVLTLLGACDTPDRPARLPDRLPGAVTTMLAPDSLRVLEVGEGVTYRYVWTSRGPWAVHLLEVDLSRCEIGLGVVSAWTPPTGARARVTEMLSADERAVAGVNGDFFTVEGRPVGVEVVKGEVRRRSSRPALAWQAGKPPWIGVPEVWGESALQLGWAVHGAEPDGVTEAVGGFPELLDGGRRVGDLEVTARPAFAASRHPRTAVGYRGSSATGWLVVVDGRQEGYSEGMTLPELTELLEALGTSEALNLDGGGSSVMVLRGRAASRPSDTEGERPVVNGLVVRRDFKYCQAPFQRGP